MTIITNTFEYFLCARNCPKCHTHIISFNLHEIPIIVPIFQVRILRQKKSTTASKGQNEDESRQPVSLGHVSNHDAGEPERVGNSSYSTCLH